MKINDFLNKRVSFISPDIKVVDTVSGVISYIVFIIFFIIIISNSLDYPDTNNLRSDWSYAICEQDTSIEEIKSLNFRQIKEDINQVSLINFLDNKNEGFIVLQKEFRLGDEFRSRELSLVLGRIMIADQTYFNGIMVGEGGRMPPRFFNEWNKLRKYDIPSVLLKFDDINTIHIKIYANTESNIMGAVFVSDRMTADRIYRFESLVNSILNLMVSFTLAIFGLYHLLIYVKRPREDENLYYAILCFLGSIYLSNFFISYIYGFLVPDISYILYQKIVFAVELLSMIALSVFLCKFLKVDPIRNIRKGFNLFSFGYLFFMSLIPSYRLFYQVRNQMQIIVIIYILYCLVVIITAARKRNSEAILIFSNIFIALFCVGYDVIFRMIMKELNGPYISALGFSLFVIGIASVVSIRFSNKSEQLEMLKSNLELKVEERTAELERINNELAKAAATDQLTGLFNRVELEKKLKVEQIRVDRYLNKKHQEMTIMFIDLDNFKYYNDNFGHSVGDTVLQKFSDILRRSTRNVDILTRFGGDEFIIILPETKKSFAIIVAERIIDYLSKSEGYQLEISEILERPIVIKQENRLTCSIGIAEYTPGCSIEKLMKRADNALYRAKSEGKNRYALA